MSAPLQFGGKPKQLLDLAELGMVGITVPLSGGTAMLERSAARSDAVVLVEADEASIATLLHTIQRVRRAAPRAVLLVAAVVVATEAGESRLVSVPTRTAAPTAAAGAREVTRRP